MHNLMNVPHEHSWILTKHEISPNGAAVALYRCLICKRLRRVAVGRLDPNIASPGVLQEDRAPDLIRRR